MNRGKWPWRAGAMAIAIAAAMAAGPLVFAWTLYTCAHDAAAQDGPAPARTETYTWGSFDEVRMTAYYPASDHPDGPRVPNRIWGGRCPDWSLLKIIPPDRSESGDWEAVYRETADHN